jgi:hypothetical protein
MEKFDFESHRIINVTSRRRHFFQPMKQFHFLEITYSENFQANYILSLRKYTDLSVMLDIDVCMIYITFPELALLQFSGNSL